MFTVGRHERFDFLSAEYRDLFTRADATLFQHPVWLHRLYASLAPAVRAQPLVITVADDAGRLALVLPLVRRRRPGRDVVEFADLGVCDRADAVVDPDLVDELAADPAVREGVRQAIGEFDLLHVERVAGSANRLGRLLGTTEVVRHRYATHAIALPASFDGWRAGLDPAFARHLDRKRKRLRAKGAASLQVVTGAEEIEAALVQMQDFRRARFAHRRGIDMVQDPSRFAFYREVAWDSARLGGPGQTTVLRVGEEVAAVSFGLVDADRHVFLLIGYDFTRLRNYSLGLLMVEDLVATAIADGRRTFDLTVGDEPYKADFGAVPEVMLTVRRSATRRGAALKHLSDGHIAARQLAKQALRYRREHLSRPTRTPADR